jgi:hypothetical protein
VIPASANAPTVPTPETTSKRLIRELFFRRFAEEPKSVATAPATAAKKSTAHVTDPAMAALPAAIVPTALIIRSTYDKI